MAYKVVYLDQVEKDLRTLDKATARKILNRIETYLVQDPKELGKALTGDFRGYWRYRWGDYRVIYNTFIFYIFTHLDLSLVSIRKFK